MAVTEDSNVHVCMVFSIRHPEQTPSSTYVNRTGSTGGLRNSPQRQPTSFGADSVINVRRSSSLGAVSVINVCGHHRLGWLLHHEQSPGVDPVINVNIPGRARHPLDQVFHWYNARLVVNACVGARPSKLSPGWRTPLLYCATVQHSEQSPLSTLC